MSQHLPCDHVSRRHFLQKSAGGIGSIALADLLGNDTRGNDKCETVQPADPLQPRPPHFRPLAKRVIFLTMAGAPSQLDLFTPKPVMRKHHGERLPASILGHLDDALIKGSARVFASPRRFQRHGKCGMEFSDYLPHLAGCADDLCMIRSMTTDVSNHHPAQLVLNCGVPRFGLPSMGSWITYGLGSESRNLPAYAVLLSNNGPGDLGGTALWGNAFLPASYRGVTFRSRGEPILHLTPPQGISRAGQRARISAVADLNSLHLQERPSETIASRTAAYELAFRMQMAAPEMIDFSNESARTLDHYGIADKSTNWFGSNCLLARRMVERGVRFIQLYHYTWDDHSQLNKRLQTNCKMTDQPAAALIQDLKQRGLLEDTLVIWGGEFGRTPMNEVRRGNTPGQEGRDHHPFGFTMLMAGGGVKPGYVLGDTDDFGYHAIERRVHIHDLQATILHCLGLNHEQLTYRHQGRDFRLTDVAGEVIHDALQDSG